jgi:hypothetical protein
MQVPVAGGTPVTDVSSAVVPANLVVSGSTIYFTDQGTGNTDGAVLKLTLK